MYALALVLVIAIVISIWAVSQWDYADIRVHLFTNETALSSSGEIIVVDLITKNQGNLGGVPSYKVSVINATIVEVEIEGIQKQRLSDFCQIDETSVTISNFTILGGRSSFVLATINIVPNEEALRIVVSSRATVPFDLLHPKNRASNQYSIAISD